MEDKENETIIKKFCRSCCQEADAKIIGDLPVFKSHPLMGTNIECPTSGRSVDY